MLPTWLRSFVRQHFSLTRRQRRRQKPRIAPRRFPVEELEPRVLLASHTYVVPGQAGRPVRLAFEWTGRDARFNNELGVYAVADGQGGVGGLHPGQAGYAESALRGGQVLFASGSGAGA